MQQAFEYYEAPSDFYTVIELKSVKAHNPNVANPDGLDALEICYNKASKRSECQTIIESKLD